MSTLAGWEELQRPLDEEKAADNPGFARPILDTLRAPVPLWVVLAVVTVTSIVFGGTLYLVKGGLFAPQEPPRAAAMTLPSPTPEPTATPTPTPTPTPLPQLAVWAPGGECAYVRPEPDGLSEPLACIPNGTMVIDLGQRQHANGGMEWVRVQYPTADGYASTGWMAFGVVVWDFSPHATTGDRETAFYEAQKVSITRWLPPHTPVLVNHEEDGWAWVQLPNREWGWVKSTDLAK